jgi:hypothetical protein
MMEDNVNIKQKIEDILTETRYSEQRAAKMIYWSALLPNSTYLTLIFIHLYQTAVGFPRCRHSLRMIQSVDAIRSEWHPWLTISDIADDGQIDYLFSFPPTSQQA